jgi:hypothetical protein
MPTTIYSNGIVPTTNLNVLPPTLQSNMRANPIKHYRIGQRISLDADGNIISTSIKTTKPSKMISMIMDRPGGYSMTRPILNSSDCNSTCNGNIITTEIFKDVQPNTVCNALKRVRGASTIVTNNYYNSSKQYLQSKCRTYDRASRPANDSNNNVYKPNNETFSTQGAVSSSNYILHIQNQNIILNSSSSMQ